MRTNDLGPIVFHHANGCMITMFRSFMTMESTWALDPNENDYPALDVAQFLALPFLCQTTIDAMDQDADLIDFGRYA